METHLCAETETQPLIMTLPLPCFIYKIDFLQLNMTFWVSLIFKESPIDSLLVCSSLATKDIHLHAIISGQP